MQDTGEEPYIGKFVYLIDEANLVQVAATRTDHLGRYTFSGLNDATYNLQYGHEDWWAIRQDWVPTTTGTVFPRHTVNLVGQATANFGWRQIVKSTDKNTPITSLTAPNGLKVKSYNDVISATELYNRHAKGGLIADETAYTTISFGLVNSNYTELGADGGPGNYANFIARVELAYVSWLESEDNLLFHEYGHAWSHYYNYIENQKGVDFTEYMGVRGLADDPRVGSSHGWSPVELIAEDYRQLFGSPTAQAAPQENREIPLAKDVPGLKEYLSGQFMAPKRDTQAPSVPTGLSGQPTSQTEIKITWNPSTDNVGVKQYYVYRDGQNAAFINSPSTTFVDIGLKPNTSYKYHLRAVDAAGNFSNESQSITVKTLAPDTQAPTAPGGLTSPSQTQTTIGLKWNPSTDNVGVTEYKVYRIGGTRKNTFNTLVGTTTGTTYTVTGLTKGTSYSFYVVAIDAAGNSSMPSNTLTIKTKR